MSFSRGSSRPRDQTRVSYGSCIPDGFFTAESPGKRGVDGPILQTGKSGWGQIREREDNEKLLPAENFQRVSLPTQSFSPL